MDTWAYVWLCGRRSADRFERPWIGAVLRAAKSVKELPVNPDIVQEAPYHFPLKRSPSFGTFMSSPKMGGGCFRRFGPPIKPSAATRSMRHLAAYFLATHFFKFASSVGRFIQTVAKPRPARAGRGS
jgi:hypothetical protein